jgi:energy-coupling factor transporter ATP-binding protein EcfA2
VRKDLHSWISSQPLWRQQAFRYLLAQPQLEGEQREQVKDLLIAYVGYAKAKRRPAPKPIELGEVGAESKVAEIIRLLRLFGLTQVNALPTDTELCFEPEGLTIVYGENGVGKSSYVRSLKRLCRSVDKDKSILPNVLMRGAQAGKPRAHIEWTRAGDSKGKEQEFDLADPLLSTPISSISVFDSRCAQIYVDEENQLAFVPSVVRVLIRLAEEQVTIQGEVEGLISTALGRKPDFGGIATETKAREAIDALSATTDLTKLEALSTLAKPETVRRNQLELAFAAVATGQSERQQGLLRGEATSLRELATRLNVAASMLAQKSVQLLRKAANDAKTKRAAARLAADEAFADEQLLGVGSEPWKELWESARRFYTSVHQDGREPTSEIFPDTSEEAECPLCFQDLDEAARNRFQRFEIFVKSDAEEKASNADRALGTELKRFDEQTLANCRTACFHSLKKTNEELYRTVNDWLKDAGKYLSTLLTSPTSGVWPQEPLCDPPTDELEELAKARDKDADAVHLAVKPEERTALEKELRELKARGALAGQLDDAREWVSELGRLAALEKAKAELSTRGVSIKQKELTEQVVTAALKNQLRTELDALGFTHIAFELKPRGVRGTTMLQLRLREAPDQELAAILSDGEKRALALAFFLAEVATAENHGGIVLDDPVSSLDQERRSVVAQRIAKESGERQVILFTHDIAFLFHVQVETEKILGREPKMQQVWRAGDMVGRTTPGAPFEACGVKKRIGWLRNGLQEMPKENEFKTPDERRVRIRSWYEHLRSSWERAVEEIVFNGTVERFSPSVQTQRLKDVSICQEMLDAVDRGMTSCSKWVHDPPVGVGAELPDRLQMDSDLDALADFREKYRPR